MILKVLNDHLYRRSHLYVSVMLPSNCYLILILNSSGHVHITLSMDYSNNVTQARSH